MDAPKSLRELAAYESFPGLSVRYLRENLVLPLKQEDGQILLAMAHPDNKELQAAMEVALEAVQLFGGNGYIRGEYMIERIWRDLRVARVYDGSSEVQQIVIARQLRKGDVETGFK